MKWTATERKMAIATLVKIHECQTEGSFLPPDVFKHYVRCVKRISTELAIFDSKGRIYLIRRPSLTENPHEDYPGQLHCPGVTHMAQESYDQAWERLCATELNNVPIRGPILVGDAEHRGVRGFVTILIRAGMVPEGTSFGDPKGSFYHPKEIPWDEVVESHRSFVIPRARNYFDLGYI